MVLLFYFSLFKFPFLLQLVPFTEQGLSIISVKGKNAVHDFTFIQGYLLVGQQQGSWGIKKGHGQSHQQRFKWLVSILFNLTWDQLGFTKSHKDLKLIDKILSAYQNDKIINFYDGIISSEPPIILKSVTAQPHKFQLYLTHANCSEMLLQKGSLKDQASRDI